MAAAEDAHATTRRLHRQMIAQAEEQVNQLLFKDLVVMVVSSSRWHQGLVGPVASQLARRYGRPAIAIAMDEHRGVGSGRSVPRINLVEVLDACRESLVQFGGHAQACGLTVERRLLEQFRARVNEHARRQLGTEGLVQTRWVDLDVPLAAVATDWVAEADRFAPFGQANPEPNVVIRGVQLQACSARTAVLSDGTTRLAAKGRLPVGLHGDRYDVVGTPGFSGGELVLTLTDVRDAAALSAPVRT